ncbi:GNAT family N-acetyltransferase [Candidatus Bathyarchaeota archaeon]|nr:GNAT family N-acetyltransferase [Candidatus Bathyarchaeota archaeon]
MSNFSNDKKALDFEIINAKNRVISEDEIRQIAEIEHSAEVKKWLVIHLEDTIEKEYSGYKQFFKDLKKEKEAEVLIARINGIILGFLVLWRLEDYMNHVVSVGISVNPNYWGKGVATQLINSAITLAKGIGVKRLEVETIAENWGMRKAAENAGFKFESTKPKRLFKDGKYYDEVTYYLLIEEN